MGFTILNKLKQQFFFKQTKPSSKLNEKQLKKSQIFKIYPKTVSIKAIFSYLNKKLCFITF